MLPLLPILLGANAITLAIFAKLSWFAVAAMTLLLVEAASAAWGRTPVPVMLPIRWLCTLIGGGLLFQNLPGFTAALSALLFATALLTAGQLAVPAIRTHWRKLGLVWLLAGGLACLARAYTENLPLLFFAGIGVVLVTLILCKLWLALPSLAVLTINTLVLLLIGLPVADWLTRPHYHQPARPDPAAKYYSYEVAQKDPGGFVAWNHYATIELRRLNARFYEPDPAGILPYRLRPNARGLLFNSTVAINNLGFRGPEISRDKSNAFRIVALGESTTFGETLNPGDRPWPELLAQIIAERLKPSRPVEVINAGVPGYTILNNLARLQKEILPLQPDLIISYHGFNGFPLISSTLPPVLAPDPPVYYERPLKLLADFEFALRVSAFNRRQMSLTAPSDSPASDLMATAYARAYRELIAFAQTNHIHLALANYSMAVNEHSDPRVIEFYRKTCPVIYEQIKVNTLHSQLVQRLVEQNPQVTFLDTHPALDGRHDNFIDVVHFAHSGEEQMAENVFAALAGLLAKEISAPASRTN
jgi:lysophospholipase L1-like esterase